MSKIYSLKLTEEQVLSLFALKRFFQDQLGVHYDSGWHNLQCSQFIDDIIICSRSYWKGYNIEEYLARIKSYLPKDFRGKEVKINE